MQPVSCASFRSAYLRAAVRAGEEGRRVGAEGSGQRSQVADGDVAHAFLDLAQEARRQPRRAGQLAQRQAALAAELAHTAAQCLQQAVLSHEGNIVLTFCKVNAL